ncbi:hypothetical protein, partial [Pseudomonas aeruginosa]|uniref:hypothetical protein n=1 Tax=Pseudomonas aeruginosa TaxID=287 RepID=UPI001C720B9C
FLAGLLALAGVLGVGEGHLLHRKALRVKSADFAKSGSLFQSFLKTQFRTSINWPRTAVDVAKGTNQVLSPASSFIQISNNEVEICCMGVVHPDHLCAHVAIVLIDQSDY